MVETQKQNSSHNSQRMEQKMKTPKFVYQGIRGPTDHAFRYAVDVHGKCWVSDLPWKSNPSGFGGLDFEAPIVWRRPTKEDNFKEILSSSEVKDKGIHAMTFLHERSHNNASEYVTKHTGGSIRHAGIRVMDVMEMIHDYSYDAQRAIEDAYALGKLHATKTTRKKKA